MEKLKYIIPLNVELKGNSKKKILLCVFSWHFILMKYLRLLTSAIMQKGVVSKSCSVVELKTLSNFKCNLKVLIQSRVKVDVAPISLLTLSLHPSVWPPVNVSRFSPMASCPCAFASVIAPSLSVLVPVVRASTWKLWQFSTFLESEMHILHISGYGIGIEPVTHSGLYLPLPF